MSKSKKNWNASKALKRSAEAIKKTVKITAKATTENKRRIFKGRVS